MVVGVGVAVAWLLFYGSMNEIMSSYFMGSIRAEICFLGLGAKNGYTPCWHVSDSLLQILF